LLTLTLAGVTMTAGSVLALFQTRVRRIFACTTLSHGGFILLGIAAGWWDAVHPAQQGASAGGLPSGVQSAVFYLAAYTVMTAGWFSVLAYLARPSRQIEFVDDLAGLIRTEPLAAACGAVFLFGLAGIPPLAGFWGRLFLLTSALAVQVASPQDLVPRLHDGFFLLAMVLLLNSLLLAAIYLRLVVTMFLEGNLSRLVPTGGQPALAAALLAAVATFGVGLLPGPLLDYVQKIEFVPHSRQQYSGPL
jgi:NADH-quinone oxidoreductase subunit N